MVTIKDIEAAAGSGQQTLQQLNAASGPPAGQPRLTQGVIQREYYQDQGGQWKTQPKSLFWREFEEAQQRGPVRLVPKYAPASAAAMKLSPSYNKDAAGNYNYDWTGGGVRESADEMWMRGRRGLTIAGANGRTFEQMLEERDLARFPNAKEMNRFGEPLYHGATHADENLLMAETALKYGEREIAPFGEEDLMRLAEEGRGENVAQQLTRQTQAYRDVQSNMAKEQGEKSLNSTYNAIYNTVGNPYHRAKTWAQDHIYTWAGDKLGMSFLGDVLLDDKTVAAIDKGHARDARTAGIKDDIAKYWYSDTTYLTGRAIADNVLEQILWAPLHWFPWQDEAEKVGRNVNDDILRALEHAEENPAAEAWQVAKYEEPDYWRQFQYDFLNPVDMILEIPLGMAGEKVIAGAAKGVMKFVPEVLHSAGKMYPEIARAISGIDELSRIGGLGADAMKHVRQNSIVAAVMDGSRAAADDMAVKAKSINILMVNNESKAALMAEEVDGAVRGALRALGDDADPAEFVAYMRQAANLASEDPEQVAQALEFVLSRPEYKYWLTQNGQAASLTLRNMFEESPRFLDNLPKKLADAVDEADRMGIMLDAMDGLTARTTKDMFPKIVDQVGRNPWLKSAAKVHEGVQAKVYGPMMDVFSTMYLKLTPGYAVRNMVQNTVQIAYDLGLDSVYKWKHMDDAYDWAGALHKTLGDDVAKKLMVGMEREMAGVTGAIGRKVDAAGIINKYGAGRWAADFENIGRRSVFAHVYPREMEKILRSNLTREMQKITKLPTQYADRFETLIMLEKGNVENAYGRLIGELDDGYWRALNTEAVPAGLRQKLGDYKLTNEFNAILTEEDNWEMAAARWDDYIEDWLEQAEKSVLKQTPAPRGDLGPVVDHGNTQVMANGFDRGLNQVVTDYITANKATERSLKQATTTWLDQVVDQIADLPMAKGSTHARQIVMDFASEIRLSSRQGTTFDILGEFTGADWLGGRFSGYTEDIFGMEANILRRSDTRLADLNIARENDDILGFWKKSGLEDEFGSIEGLQFIDVRNKVHQSRNKELMGFWIDWREDNFRYGEEIIETITAKANGMGGNVKAPAEFLQVPREKLAVARKYDKHTPKVMQEWNIQKARDLSRKGMTQKANRIYVAEYARRYGLDIDFMKDGKQFLNEKKLTSIINKQLNKKFDNLNDITGVSEREIAEALRLHSVDEMYNVIRSPEKVTEIVQKLTFDPDLLDVGDLRKVDDTLRILEEIDPVLGKQYRTAIYDRIQYRGMDEAALSQPKIQDAIEGANEEVARIGDEVAQVLDMEQEELMTVVEKVVDEQAVMDNLPSEWGGESAPDFAQVLHNSRDGIRTMKEQVKGVFKAKFDEVVEIPEVADAKLLKSQLEDAKKLALGMVGDARTGAMNTTKELGDFVLLNYGRRTNLDTLLAYIYPYHFWHSRTAMNWVQRIAKDPKIARYYVKYKENMRKINKDMPEWYRHNIAYSGGLMGFDKDNPLFINIEAMLSPLYQFMKTPFEDKDMQATSAGKWLDTLGQRGPSTHTMYSLILGAAMYTGLYGDKEKAEEEGADLREGGSKWLGRLVPQTQQITALTAMAGLNKGRGVNLDPVLGLQGASEAGGSWMGYISAQGPWQKKRTAMAFQGMEESGKYTEEQIMDALVENDLDNPILIEAQALAQSKRSVFEILSYFGGPAAKARGADEMKVLKAQDEISRLFERKDFLSPEDYAGEWARMRDKYPVYFTVTQLAKRSAEEREEAYAYNVLSRIPPARTDDVARELGLDPKLMSSFYESNGDSLKTMPEADRMRFMAAMFEIGAVTALPDGATRNEWTQVRAEEKKIVDQLVEHYGQETYDAKQIYFDMLKTDREAAYLWIAQNPDVGNLMSDETWLETTHPLVSKYYGSYGAVKSMMSSEMYDRLDENYAGIQEEIDAYYQKKNTGQKVSPSDRMKQYWADRDTLQMEYDEELVTFARLLPEGPQLQIREDVTEDTLGGLPQGAQQLLGTDLGTGVPEYYQWGWQDWEQKFDPIVARLVQDWAFRGAPLPYDAEKSMTRALEPYGVELYEGMTLMQDAARDAGAQYYGPENLPWWLGEQE